MKFKGNRKFLIFMDILIIFSFIFAVTFTIVTYRIDPNIFCIEAKGEIDIMDEGNICYKSLGEIKERAIYLTEKYRDEPEFVINLPNGT